MAVAAIGHQDEICGRRRTKEEKMRKPLVWVSFLCRIGVSVMVAGLASAAPNTQSIEVKVKPTKGPKNKRLADLA